MAEATIIEAESAGTIGERLIEEHHHHLRDARVLYLFTDQKKTAKGKVLLGWAEKLSTKERYLATRNIDSRFERMDLAPDFIVWLWYGGWDQLTAEQQEALVDHELMHCSFKLDSNGEPQWIIRGHDVEEFSDVIDRHGLWEPAIREMAEVIAGQQLVMAFQEGEVSVEVTHGSR